MAAVRERVGFLPPLEITRAQSRTGWPSNVPNGGATAPEMPQGCGSFGGEPAGWCRAREGCPAPGGEFAVSGRVLVLTGGEFPGS